MLESVDLLFCERVLVVFHCLLVDVSLLRQELVIEVFAQAFAHIVDQVGHVAHIVVQSLQILNHWSAIRVQYRRAVRVGLALLGDHDAQHLAVGLELAELLRQFLNLVIDYTLH